MKRVRKQIIRVTQDDIDEARRRMAQGFGYSSASRDCPIAIAVRREIDDDLWVAIGSVGRNSGIGNIIAEHDASQWEHDFDMDKPVSPIDVTLTFRG